MGIHWKIRFLEEVYKKNIYEGLPKKGYWTVCRFNRRAWQKRGGGAFCRVDTPIQTMLV